MGLFCFMIRICYICVTMKRAIISTFLALIAITAAAFSAGYATDDTYPIYESNDSNWLWGVLSNVITAGFGGFIGWFFTRRKQTAEAQGTELENVEKALRVYREMVEDLRSRLNNVVAEMDALQREFDQLSEEHRKAKAEIEELKRKKS